MPEIKKQKRVLIFTSPGCSLCTTAKQYLKKNNIKFNTIDTSKNPDAIKDCQRHGCHGAPVLLIGSRWICGFDKAKINKELGL